MKKHSFKKILALLIAIMMVIPAIPVVASAATTTKSVTELLEDDQYVDDLGAWLVSVRDTTVAPKKEATDDAPASGYTYNLTTRDDLIYFMLCGQLASGSTIDVEAGSFLNCVFRLKNDITLNYGTATESGFVPDTSKQDDVIYLWSPFGVAFRGNFQGGKNTIYGMVIQGSGDNIGMFKTLGVSAYFNGLYFEDAYVKGTRYAGIVAGRNTASTSGRQGMDNVRVTDSVVKGTTGYIGGLVGGTSVAKLLFRNIVLDNCSVSATGTCVGGIVGIASKGVDFEGSTKVTNCTVTAGTSYAGGLVGRGTVYTNIANAVVSGTTVSSTGAADKAIYVGGLIGGVSATDDAVGVTTVNNSKIDVTVSGGRYVGGVIGEAQGDVTLDGISADVAVTAVIAAGGLYGRPSADVTTAQTISISNSFVDGTVTATTYLAGGFIAATGKHTANISNSICAANVSVTGTGSDGRVSSGGFIGVAEATTTMTNCQFLGVSDSNQSAFTAAFAVVSDITGAASPNINPTAPESHYKATFTDCYFASGSADHALAVYHRSSGTLNNWYDVTIDYTSDDAAAVTVDLTTLYGSGEGQATGQGAQGELLSANMKTYYLDTSAAEKATAIGAQMGDNDTARVVATVAGNANITDVEFSSISLAKYMTSVVESGNRPWQSYSPAVETKCDQAYKSLNANYGLETIEADENEYLIALGITGIKADTATTVLVRPVYWDKTVDETTASGFVENEDGSIKTVKRYGQYMGVIFYNGDILGTFYMG